MRNCALLPVYVNWVLIDVALQPASNRILALIIMEYFIAAA
jgi:hypothetical protein